jgi:hypothetical protein
MSNLKNIGNKLFKETTELKSHDVELGLSDDLEKLNNNYYSSTDSANGIIKGLLSEARRAESKIDQAIKNANKIDALIPKVEKAAKDLGVDPNSISELKSSKLAIREASEYKKVLSTINKFISSI